jgi:hypothetical protein
VLEFILGKLVEAVDLVGLKTARILDAYEMTPFLEVIGNPITTSKNVFLDAANLVETNRGLGD